MKNLDHKKCVLRFVAGPETERLVSNRKQKKTMLTISNCESKSDARRENDRIRLGQKNKGLDHSIKI